MSEQLAKWVTFFKALADENRLRIIGLLAQQPQAVEELAANLGVSPATVSHHLQKLQQADLVEARVQQYYNVYALHPDILRQMAEQLTADSIRTAAPPPNQEGYATKVLSEYIAHGRLKEIPSQLRKREVILGRIADEFEPGKRYSEKRVNEILKQFHADGETLRRELIKRKLLARERGFYWRVSDDKRSQPSPFMVL